ncbi:MAG: hypothetical protein IPI46_02975 [Bacteroidetes bacterium]|nr:hypothetical protein [Bacteroidota bacterium]
MNERCQQAYHYFMAMRVKEARNLLQEEIKANPKNILPFVLINYEDFISLVFNENPSDYHQKKYLKDKRLKLLEGSDQKSPYYLFSKALIHFQWSMIQIKYSDYWDAAWDFRKSYVLFKENEKKFPKFVVNQIFSGSQEAVISAIPSGYKWISNVLGMKGNMKHGMSKLANFIQSGESNFIEEAYLYNIYLKNYLENDVEGAAKFIQIEKIDTKNNQLFCFMAANLALNNKNAKRTEELIINRNKKDEFIPFPMLDYELGDALLRKLDYTSSIKHFKLFITESKGNFYQKDACMSISFAYYLAGNREMADHYKLKIKQIGKAESDADKLAQKFSKDGLFPDKELLKARLLNDGGYHERSLEILDKLTLKKWPLANEKLEYTYRLARVYDDLQQDDKALAKYKETIQTGSTSTAYFAARAALQAAYIYEKRNQKKQALECFQKVLDLDDHDFKNSLDQRAKAGINRIKGE